MGDVFIASPLTAFTFIRYSVIGKTTNWNFEYYLTSNEKNCKELYSRNYIGAHVERISTLILYFRTNYFECGSLIKIRSSNNSKINNCITMAWVSYTVILSP